MIQMWQEIKEEKREHKYWEAKTTQLCLSVLEWKHKKCGPVFWSPSAQLRNIN